MTQALASSALEPHWERAARHTLPYELRVVESGQMVMARVEGPLDVQSSAAFQERLMKFCEPKRCVVVDLRRADYIDSQGVRALIRLHERLEAAGSELRLVVRPSSRVQRVLTLLRLVDRFRIFPTGSDAWLRRADAA